MPDLIVPEWILRLDCDAETKLIMAFMEQHPFSTIRDISDGTGLSVSSIRRVRSISSSLGEFRSPRRENDPPLGGVTRPRMRARVDDRKVSKKRGKNDGKRNISRNDLLAFWNGLEGVRKHREGTKVSKKARSMLKGLQRGSVLPKNHLKLRANCRTQIDDVLRPWTDMEVRTALYHVSLLFNDAYWPPDKSTIPRDLPTLIYNPRTQFSWVASYRDAPPELLKTAARPEICIAAEQVFQCAVPDSFEQWFNALREQVHSSSVGRYLYRDNDAILNAVRDHLLRLGLSIQYNTLTPGAEHLERIQRELVNELQ